MQHSEQPTAYLIDASIYIFRAWFSIPDSMRGEEGMPINAVYGFTRFLTEFVERVDSPYVGIAFDESLTRSFRNELYPAYKMNRELPPEDLAKQFSLCRRVAEAAGFYCVSHSEYEADDLVATMARVAREAGVSNVIVSADKDLTQVMRGTDYFWDYARNQKLGAPQVVEKFGVPPEAIQDYLGLCGDAVDNIPGVPGVGPKTATALLQEYGNIETLYENLSGVAQLPIRGAAKLGEKLAQHEEQAKLSKLLATVVYDVPVSIEMDDLQRRCAEVAPFRELTQIMAGRAEGLFNRLIAASKG